MCKVVGLFIQFPVTSIAD